MYSYLIWLLIFVLLPLGILWWWQGKTLKKYVRALLLAILGALVFSIPWDLISVKERIWYFTEPQILGVWLFGLPIEEYVFIVFVTLLFASATILLWERFGYRDV